MGKETVNIVRRVTEYVQAESLFSNNARIIVAVSGGIDSVVLLNILYELRTEYDLQLIVAHVNYGLRAADSKGDEEFVEHLGKRLDLPVYVHRQHLSDLTTPGRGSLQERAREVRYRFFENLRRERGFDLIATGHTADDNAETVFLNLIRGAGVEGLRGIPPKRDKIIRPLLTIGRDEISAYAHQRGLDFRIDVTNATDAYARNIVRNEIFPLIEQKLRENVSRTLNRSSVIFRELHQYMVSTARSVFGDTVTHVQDDEYVIHVEKLRELPSAPATYLLREIIFRLIGRSVNFQTIHQVLKLQGAHAGTSVILAPGYRAYRETNAIRFLREGSADPFHTLIEHGKEYQFDTFVFRTSIVPREEISLSSDPHVEYADFDAIEGPMYLRSWKEGDRLIPLGMNSYKKVSDLFIDAKIPRAHKQKIPIVEAHGEIIWVCGIRLDERVKITENTSRALKLEYIPKNQKTK